MAVLGNYEIDSNNIFLKKCRRLIQIKTINEITPIQLAEVMERSDHIIIDVREKKEVVNGMIKDAIHIPLQSIPESLERLNNDKHYVLVCRSGSRSHAAALYLQKIGYQVSNLE